MKKSARDDYDRDDYYYDEDEYEDYVKQPPMRRKQGLTPIAKFLITVVVTVVFFLVGSVVILATYSNAQGISFNENVLAVARAIESNLKGTTEGKKGNFITNLFNSVPEHTNFAIFGNDDGVRTDTIIVGSFNSKSGEVMLISIPRDTYVIMSKDKRDILAEKGVRTPSNGEMKINAVSAYAGEQYAMPFIVKQLEELLDIKIEYYANINLEAFRFIVDEIGGVTFDVPQRMYYNDPEQNLYIDLQPGVQLLNGEQAEGLVRYRKADINNPISQGYASADLQRVEVQQNFIKALANQILSKQTILGNIPALFEVMSKYVDTNFGLQDLSLYTKYILNFDADKINTFTLPGNARYKDGVSYFFADANATAEIIAQYFSSTPEPTNVVSDISGSENNEVNNEIADNETNSNEEIAGNQEISSKGKNIQVLNGGYVNGLAARTRDMLIDEGYNVVSIGDFRGTRQAYTQIVVRHEGLGTDLMQYFDNSKIVIDTNINENYDIVIVLGTE